MLTVYMLDLEVNDAESYMELIRHAQRDNVPKPSASRSELQGKGIRPPILNQIIINPSVWGIMNTQSFQVAGSSLPYHSKRTRRFGID